MNVRILWNGTSINKYLLSCKREHVLCDGIGTLTFSLSKTCPYQIDAWDTVVLYEDSIKKGTYRVSRVSNADPKAEITVDCQDDSKRLTDYFIDHSYTMAVNSNSRYWIELFLQQAGVTYSFNTTGSGVQLSDETVLGMDFAASIITNLLKQNAWYIYFNEDNTAIIGEMNITSSSTVLTDKNIVEIELANDDKSLRNRAVVWGGSGYWPGTSVGVEAVTRTPWDVDDKDKRSVVYTNTGIRTNSAAYTLAQRILTEFDTISSVKTVKLVGIYNLKLSQRVDIKNKDVYTGDGVITSISSEMSSSGLFTTLVLDEKCPRMFGFYKDGEQYVYTSFLGAGVWRKPLPSPVWEDYSQGLQSMLVEDLQVNKGLLTCVAGGAGYKRTTSESTWSKLVYGNLESPNGTIYGENDTSVVACAIDKSTNELYWGVRLTDLTPLSWVVKTDSALNVIETYKVVIKNDGNIFLYDVDTDDTAIYITGRKDYGLIIPGGEKLCNYSFTTNDTLTPSRSWNSGAVNAVSDPVFCGGKVYYVVQALGNYTQCRIYIDDHSNSPLVSVNRTISSAYTFASDPSEKNITSVTFFDKNANTLYFTLVIYSGAYDSHYREVIAYDIASDTFTSLGTFYADITGIYYNGYFLVPFYRITVTEIMPHMVATQQFFLKYVDLKTLSETEIPITDDLFEIYNQAFMSSLGLTIIGSSADYKPGFHHERSFNRVNLLLQMQDEGDWALPEDNIFIGGDNYVWSHIKRYWACWLEFNTDSGTITSSGTFFIHPNSDLNSTDSLATVHDDYVTGFSYGSHGNYDKLGPIFYMYNVMKDVGKWIPNPNYPGLLEPPYIKEGARDWSVIGAPYVYRIFSINLSNGELKPQSQLPNSAPLLVTGLNQYCTAGYPVYGGTNGGFTFLSSTYLDSLFSVDGTHLFDKTDYKDNKIITYENNYLAGLVYFYSNAGQLLGVHTVTGFNPLANSDDISSIYSGENILAFRRVHVAAGNIYTMLLFEEYSTYSEITLPLYITAKNTAQEENESFIVLDLTTQHHRLEISHQGTIATFAYSGRVYDDSIRIGHSGGDFVSLLPEWSLEPTLSGCVNDIRIVRTMVEQPSGYLNLTSAIINSLDTTAISGGTWTNVAEAPSGIMAKVETSNFQVPASVFYVITSGDSNVFFQRLSGESSFTNMSINLPASGITSIRLDDRV